MGTLIKMGNISRIMAFCIIAVFLIGTTIGSVLPESGNILAQVLQYPRQESHIFNPIFLVIGIIGIMLACAIGHRKS